MGVVTQRRHIRISAVPVNQKPSESGPILSLIIGARPESLGYFFCSLCRLLYTSSYCYNKFVGKKNTD